MLQSGDRPPIKLPSPASLLMGSFPDLATCRQLA